MNKFMPISNLVFRVKKKQSKKELYLTNKTKKRLITAYLTLYQMSRFSTDDIKVYSTEACEKIDKLLSLFVEREVYIPLCDIEGYKINKE